MATFVAGLVAVGFGALAWLTGWGSTFAWLGVPAFVAGLAARLAVSATYLLDNDARRLRYRRALPGSVHEEDLAGFDQVQVVTVRGTPLSPQEEQSDWRYAVVLMLEDGTTLQVSQGVDRVPPANRLAEALAAHLGAAYLPGRARQVLEQVPEVKVPEVLRSDSERGGMAEVHLGTGLTYLSLGYLLGLPALLWSGPAALAALAQLWAGQAAASAAAYALSLFFFSALLGLPMLAAGGALLVQGRRAPKRQRDSDRLAEEAMGKGIDAVASLAGTHFLLGLAMTLGEAFRGPLSALEAQLAAGVLVVMSLALGVAAWQGKLGLGTEGATAELAAGTRQALLGALEHRSSRCGYCGGTILPEATVACHRCEALHHAECWEEFGRCTTYGCGGERASPLVI